MKKTNTRYSALKTAFAVAVIFLFSILATGFSFGQATVTPGTGRGDGVGVQINNTVQNPVPVTIVTGKKGSGVKTVTKEVVVHDTVTVVNNIYSQPDPNAKIMATIPEVNFVNGQMVYDGYMHFNGVPLSGLGQISNNHTENAAWHQQAKNLLAQESAPTNNWWSENWPWLLCAVLFLFALNHLWNQREQQIAERERLRRLDEEQRRSAQNLNDMFCSNVNIHERRYAQNAPPRPAQQGQGNVYAVPFEVYLRTEVTGTGQHNCPPRQ